MQEGTITKSDCKKGKTSVLAQEAFKTCDILGNFKQGFIIVHYRGRLYLVDQHAASEKTIYLDILHRPALPLPTNHIAFVPNIYFPLLSSSSALLNSMGWKYTLVHKQPAYSKIRITQAPSLFGKILKEEDFLFLVDQIYLKEGQQGQQGQQGKQKLNREQSQNEKSHLASFACHTAVRVGDGLTNSQMREIIDRLSQISAPFNCPHGRPTVIALENIDAAKERIRIDRLYKW